MHLSRAWLARAAVARFHTSAGRTFGGRASLRAQHVLRKYGSDSREAVNREWMAASLSFAAASSCFVVMFGASEDVWRALSTFFWKPVKGMVVQTTLRFVEGDAADKWNAIKWHVRLSGLASGREDGQQQAPVAGTKDAPVPAPLVEIAPPNAKGAWEGQCWFVYPHPQTGKPVYSNYVSFGKTTTGPLSPDRAVARERLDSILPLRSGITARYNPADPSEAVLLPYKYSTHVAVVGLATLAIVPCFAYGLFRLSTARIIARSLSAKKYVPSKHL